MIKQLSRPYVSREGIPVIDRVSTDIFVLTYFAQCMDCKFCHDSCCAYGVQLDAPNVKRIEDHAQALEDYVGIPQEEWFTGEWWKDPDAPGELVTRTAVIDGACVFLNRKGRGCLLHKFCLDKGIDVHELKPMIASLFPVTCDEGLLHPNLEIRDRSLICLTAGPTLYRSSRTDLEYYFGADLVAELDALEAETISSPPPSSRSIPLPLLSPEPASS